MSHAFYQTAQGEECRIPFFGPLKGENVVCLLSDPLKGKRTPHTSFRRHSKERMSHTFYRTAQGRLPKPMSSKR